MMSATRKKRARPSGLLPTEGAAGAAAAAATADGRRCAERVFSSDWGIIDVQAGDPILLKDSTGQLRFWPSLLPQETHKRLFEELTLSPDLVPTGQDTPDTSTSSTADQRLFDEVTLSPGVIHAGQETTADSSGSSSGCARRVGEDSTGRWRQRPIKLFGKEILQPRLTCFYGRKGITYKYSGKILEASPWEGVSPIREILLEVEAAAGVGGGYFNCVLLNWYRNGTDYMGWHSDNERELEKGAAIASVSLGSERRFQLRRKSDKKEKMEFCLGGGSLLLMEGNTQEHWQHRVPKGTAAELKEEARLKSCGRPLDAAPGGWSIPTFKEQPRSKTCKRLPDAASEGSTPTFKENARSKKGGRLRPLLGKGRAEKTLEGGRGSSSSSSSSSSSTSTGVRERSQGSHSGVGSGVQREGPGSREEAVYGNCPTAGRVNLTFRRVENTSSQG